MAFSDINGPTSLFSKPFPTFNFLILTTSFFRNLSKIFSSTNNLLADMQVCPAFLNFAAIKPSIALLISASAKTTKGALPPNSNEIFFTVDDESFIKSFPIFVEPVNVIFFTNEFFVSNSPINFGFPLIIFKTPFGNPAFTANSPNFKAVSGVNSDGFSITVHPAAKAAETLRVTIAKGKFHGVIATTTPTGLLI